MPLTASLCALQAVTRSVLPQRAAAAALLCVALLISLTGCATYHPPGDKADLTALAPPDIQAAFKTQPTHPFPAAIAMVRVQGSNYSSHSIRQRGGSYGSGRFTAILVREVEEQKQLDRVLALPQISGIVSLNRLALPENLLSMNDLRLAAASMQADLTFVYTFDTAFFEKDHASPLTVISLGLFPTRHVRATTTATAMLVDTRTGYIYAVYEATRNDTQFTNAWDSGDRADEARLRSEREAFEKLMDEFINSWPTLLTKAAQAAKTAAEAAAKPDEKPAPPPVP